MAKNSSIARKPLLAQTLHAWRAALVAPDRVLLASTVLTVYAALVILTFINRRSIWLDESISVAIAGKPYAHLLATVGHVDAVHALYYSLLHGWLFIGHSAIFIRLLSSIFALLAILEIGMLATRIFGPPAGPATIAILATSVFVLFYADEARPTALTLLACSATAARFWRSIGEGRTRDIRLCVAYAVVAIYASAVATIFMAGLTVSLAVLRPPRRTLVQLAGYALIGILCLMPLVVLIHANTLAQVNWIHRSGPRQVVEFFANLFGGASAPSRLGRLSQYGEFLGVMVLALIGALAALRARETRAGALALTTWLVVPLAVALCIDACIRPILIPRYFSFALIPSAILAGNGLLIIGRGARPRVAYAVVACLALLSLHTLATIQREDWRAASALVAQRARLGDGIIFWAPVTMTPFVFALNEAALRPAVRVAYPNGPLINDVAFPDPRPGFTRRIGQRFRRLWFIDSHDLTPRGQHDPFNGLASYYRYSRLQRFSGVNVIMYSR